MAPAVPPRTGGISTGNGATFSNPSQDPTALQIVIYGQAPSWPTIEFPNNLTVYAAIYAPNTGIKFKNNGNLVGGLTAQSIEFKNNAFLWDNRALDAPPRDDARLLPRRLAPVQLARGEHDHAGDRLPVAAAADGVEPAVERASSAVRLEYSASSAPHAR